MQLQHSLDQRDQLIVNGFFSEVGEVDWVDGKLLCFTLLSLFIYLAKYL